MSDESMVEAVQDAYMAYRDPGKALKKAKRLLRKPNVRERIAEIYELESFSIVDSVKLHIAHMRGDAPEGASYQALKDFQKMTIPQPAQKIDQRVVVAHAREVPESKESLPAMEARVLSASVSE